MVIEPKLAIATSKSATLMKTLISLLQSSGGGVTEQADKDHFP